MSDDKLREHVQLALVELRGGRKQVAIQRLDAALANSATAEHRWSEDKVPPGVRYCVLCVETEDVAGRKCNGPPRCTGCGSVSWAWRDQKVRRCSKCATADAPPEVTEEMVEAAFGTAVRGALWEAGTTTEKREAIRDVLRAALAAAQPDKAGGPDGVPEGPKEG